MAYDQLLQLSDNGIPNTYTAIADAVVSGGAFVKLASGAQTTTLGSRIATFNANGENIIRVNMVSTSGTGGPPGGIALQTVSSGTEVAVALNGIYILESSAAITPGLPIACTQSGTNLGQVGLVIDTEEERAIGMALTEGADGEFIVVALNLG